VGFSGPAVVHPNPRCRPSLDALSAVSRVAGLLKNLPRGKMAAMRRSLVVALLALTVAACGGGNDDQAVVTVPSQAAILVDQLEEVTPGYVGVFCDSLRAFGSEEKAQRAWMNQWDAGFEDPQVPPGVPSVPPGVPSVPPGVSALDVFEELVSRCDLPGDLSAVDS
jgi:hypothetical protein